MAQQQSGVQAHRGITAMLEMTKQQSGVKVKQKRRTSRHEGWQSRRRLT